MPLLRRMLFVVALTGAAIAGAAETNSTALAAEAVTALGPQTEGATEGAPDDTEFNMAYLTRSPRSVYFGRDSAELSEGAMATIAENAQRLKADPGEGVNLAGFTEDMGSTSYGIALAERRVAAVSDALVGLGVLPRQIRSIPYGREKAGTAACATELCRISYRRVALSYFKLRDGRK